MRKLNPSFILISAALSFNALAEGVNKDEELQDMSDPLAVFTQLGAGYTDKGLNLKIGQAYDTGVENLMGMNVIEIKGFAGEAVGFRDYPEATDSVDSVRFRNFSVDMTNGRGAQIDVSASFDKDMGTQGTASYSVIQALPKMGRLNLYPLVGMGVAFGESFDALDEGADQAQDRLDMHGTFYVAGMYSKLSLTDSIWLNYNPMYLGTMTGSETYKDYGFVGDDSVMTHEFSLSYQMSPRANVRYFANWNEEVSFEDGDHRIEINYQF